MCDSDPGYAKTRTQIVERDKLLVPTPTALIALCVGPSEVACKPVCIPDSSLHVVGSALCGLGRSDATSAARGVVCCHSWYPGHAGHELHVAPHSKTGIPVADVLDSRPFHLGPTVHRTHAV